MIYKTYSELVAFPTFQERFDYLKLSGQVGKETFGFDRIFNQVFYRSSEWQRIRREVMLRDNGCDLGISDREIHGKILIHHMNPITEKDIATRSDILLNPEYLITVSNNTHNAIHYGDEHLLVSDTLVERFQYDTCPWRL